MHKTPSALLLSDAFLFVSAGDEGSSRSVPSPGPPQLPPCPPLSNASVLAGRAGRPTRFRLSPVFSGSTHQAPRVPQS